MLYVRSICEKKLKMNVVCKLLYNMIITQLVINFIELIN